MSLFLQQLIIFNISTRKRKSVDFNVISFNKFQNKDRRLFCYHIFTTWPISVQRSTIKRPYQLFGVMKLLIVLIKIYLNELKYILIVCFVYFFLKYSIELFYYYYNINMIASNNLKLIFNQDLKTGDEYVYNVHVSLKNMEK